LAFSIHPFPRFHDRNQISKYVGPQTAIITIAKVYIFVEVGRMLCMPKIDVEKLAGRKSIEIYVRIRMFSPWVTVVRASRTAEALKSYIGMSKR
jgi:hypothetical protein